MAHDSLSNLTFLVREAERVEVEARDVLAEAERDRDRAIASAKAASSVLAKMRAQAHLAFVQLGYNRAFATHERATADVAANRDRLIRQTAPAPSSGHQGSEAATSRSIPIDARRSRTEISSSEGTPDAGLRPVVIPPAEPLTKRLPRTDSYSYSAPPPRPTPTPTPTPTPAPPPMTNQARRTDLPTLYLSSQPAVTQQNAGPTLPSGVQFREPLPVPAVQDAIILTMQHRPTPSVLVGEIEWDHFSVEGHLVDVRWTRYDSGQLSGAIQVKGVS